MKSLRETLVASHISAVAVATLVFFSLEFAVRALAGPLPGAVDFVTTAIAVHGMPYISRRIAGQFSLIPASLYLFWAIASFGGAWLLSHWAHGAGPFAYLKRYGALLRRGKNA